MTQCSHKKMKSNLKDCLVASYNGKALPTTLKLDHEYYMKEAISLAKQNPSYPFGCVIVNIESGEIIGRGLNAESQNPTFHGEIQAINDYVHNHGSKDWEKSILYTTGEPCPMCMSAIAWAGIPYVVWSSSIDTIRSSGIGQIDISAVDVALAAKEVYQPRELIAGVLSKEMDGMFNNRKYL